MKPNKVRGALIAAAIAVSVVTGVPSMSKADSGDEDRALASTAIAQANPTVPLEVIEGLPTSILDRDDIYIAPDIRPDTVFVDETGKPIAGQMPAKAAAALASDCGPKAIAAVAGSGWSPENKAKCAIIGANSSYQIPYWRTRNQASTGSACWQVKRYTWQAPTNTMVAQWVSIGCATGVTKVSWGAVAAYPGIKISGTAGYWFGTWSNG